ncbi:MAG: hypothetical protein K6G58_06445 [Lachnospiraceae bacterium]|nr:hypothetical protein [Lachnospiraceae bacterium]
MKGFGKFVTFVGVTGAALAGLWYFCEMNKERPAEAGSDGEGKSEGAAERSYVSLDPELKEDAKEVAEDVKKTAEDLKAAAADGKNTLKKAVKSAAQDIMNKAEDAARGVGIVKEKKDTSDFEFEDFDKEKESSEGSSIDIQ